MFLHFRDFFFFFTRRDQVQLYLYLESRWTEKVAHPNSHTGKDVERKELKLSLVFVLVIWYFKQWNLRGIKLEETKSCESFEINISEWSIKGEARTPANI